MTLKNWRLRVGISVLVLGLLLSLPLGISLAILSTRHLADPRPLLAVAISSAVGAVILVVAGGSLWSQALRRQMGANREQFTRVGTFTPRIRLKLANWILVGGALLVVATVINIGIWFGAQPSNTHSLLGVGVLTAVLAIVSLTIGEVFRVRELRQKKDGNQPSQGSEAT